MKLLIDAGGDFGVMLDEAVLCNREDIVDLLIKMGAEITDTTLVSAVRKGESMVNLFLMAGVNPDLMLLEAVKSGQFHILQSLIEARADVNSSHVTEALDQAPDGEALTFLIEEGADVSKSKEVLLQTVKRNDAKNLKLLLQVGADVNGSQGTKALIIAARLELVDCVNILLDAGAYVNDIYMSTTAFHAAAIRDSPEAINLMLKAGAHVNIRDSKGRTPLLNAVHNISVSSVDVLLKAGADVNVNDNAGNTVLFLPSIWFSVKRLNSYKLVLREKVKVNVTNNHGFNALSRFLKDLENDHLYARRKTSTDKELEEEFVKLLYAAGETVDESKVRKVPDYLKASTDICLKTMCREILSNMYATQRWCEFVHQSTATSASSAADIIPSS